MTSKKKPKKQPKKKDAPKPAFTIPLNSLNDVRRFMLMLDGVDPDAQQSLNKFLEFDNIIQRTNLPTRKDVQRVAYLDFAGKTLCPNIPNNPFTTASDSISLAFMAKSGWIGERFVDLLRRSPNLQDFTAYKDEPSSTMDTLLRRDKKND